MRDAQSSSAHRFFSLLLAGLTVLPWAPSCAWAQVVKIQAPAFQVSGNAAAAVPGQTSLGGANAPAGLVGDISLQPSLTLTAAAPVIAAPALMAPAVSARAASVQAQATGAQGRVKSVSQPLEGLTGAHQPAAKKDDVEAVSDGAARFDGAAKTAAAAAETPAVPAEGKGAPYRKNDIAAARFGDAERQNLIRLAMTLKAAVDKKIIGQERATKIIQDRLVQYFEGFGTRTKDPVAVQLIGLPGVGKTAILDALEQLGFTVERLDVQKYITPGTNLFERDDVFTRDLVTIAERNKGKPYILLIDELDKLTELQGGNEVTIPFIGALNQILTDGFLVSRYTGKVGFSDAMIITTMNFSPKEIEDFSASALKKPKKYYDFTIADFQAFNEWIQKDPSARYKLLSDLFRANTVSRLAPNTVIMEALSSEAYARIVKLTVDATIAKATQGRNQAKRIEVSYSQAFLDFLNANTVYAPSGARETIAKANALTEQLVNFGVKAAVAGDRSLNRPRKIALDFNPRTGKAEVSVTPQLTRNGKAAAGSPFKFEVAYDLSSKLFSQPDIIALAPPAAKTGKAAPKEKKLTKKDILAARFPKTRKLTAGLADKINASLIGQEQYTQLVEKEFNGYLNRPGPVEKQPPFLVFSGFPGIGKSELVNLTAKNLGLEVVRVNLQNFSSDSSDALKNFQATLRNALSEARAKAQKKDGKFIVLFEELDKVFEINQRGEIVNRPIMAVIKDLLQDGVATSPEGVIDVRDAFNIVTMNFAGDRFGFKADPRRTTVENVRDAARQLNMNPASLKSVLGSMFLPETVSRLMSRFYVLNPLSETDYKKLILLQAELVIKNRLLDRASGKNKSLIDVQMTPAYKRYLYSEAVIPSEGARHTVIASQNRIATHLEAAMARIPRGSALATQPVTLVLDFKPGSSTIVVSAIPQGTKAKRQVIYSKAIALTFPPLSARGRMPEERLETAVHEFGHAFTSARLGQRIDYATVIPPQAGIGGYVRYKKGRQSAKAMLARIYSALGSRAMERIFMSDDPLSPLSVMDITPGPSNDIVQATENLFGMVKELGFDPDGGTMERMGVDGQNRYANFSDLPADEVEKFGRMMRRMENYLVADLLAAHDRKWYQERIAAFAKAGGLTEPEFDKLIGHPYPGANNESLGDLSKVAKTFADQVEKAPQEVRTARAFKQGKTKTTAAQNMEAFLQEFLKIMKEELHPVPQVSAAK